MEVLAISLLRFGTHGAVYLIFDCQIISVSGFHLSASVVPLNAAMPIGNNSVFNVAVTFDRHRITSCSCTCRHAATTTWCAHVVAVCLQRIHQVRTERYLSALE